MSSYSFSHEFYQHWTEAPQPVRAAIVQELKDITSLLQTDTAFEKFVFSNHDLDAHLDDLYGAHDKQQAAAKELADKQAALRAKAEQQRLEEERRQAEKKEVEEKALAEAEAEDKRQQEALDKEAVAKEALDKKGASEENLVLLNNQSVDTDTALINTVAEVSAELDNPSTAEKTAVENDSNMKAIDDKAYTNASIDLSLKDTELSTADQQMIQELEVHIDDYLTEQMMQMSENLKSWLRAEVTRQLSEK